MNRQSRDGLVYLGVGILAFLAPFLLNLILAAIKAGFRLAWFELFSYYPATLIGPVSGLIIGLLVLSIWPEERVIISQKKIPAWLLLAIPFLGVFISTVISWPRWSLLGGLLNGFMAAFLMLFSTIAVYCLTIALGTFLKTKIYSHDQIVAIIYPFIGLLAFTVLSLLLYPTMMLGPILGIIVGLLVAFFWHEKIVIVKTAAHIYSFSFFAFLGCLASMIIKWGLFNGAITTVLISLGTIAAYSVTTNICFPLKASIKNHRLAMIVVYLAIGLLSLLTLISINEVLALIKAGFEVKTVELVRFPMILGPILGLLISLFVVFYWYVWAGIKRLLIPVCFTLFAVLLGLSISSGLIYVLQFGLLAGSMVTILILLGATATYCISSGMGTLLKSNCLEGKSV